MKKCHLAKSVIQIDKNFYGFDEALIYKWMLTQLWYIAVAFSLTAVYYADSQLQNHDVLRHLRSNKLQIGKTG